MCGVNWNACYINLTIARRPTCNDEPVRVFTPAELEAGLAYLNEKGLIYKVRAEFVTVFSDGTDARELMVWDAELGGLREYNLFKDREMSRAETFLIRSILVKHTRDCENCGHTGSVCIKRAIKWYYPFKDETENEETLTRQLRGIMGRWRHEPATRPHALQCRQVERGAPGEEVTAYEWWFDEKTRFHYEFPDAVAPLNIMGYWREWTPSEVKVMGRWFTVWASNGLGFRFMEPAVFSYDKAEAEKRAAELMIQFAKLKPTGVDFDKGKEEWLHDEDHRVGFACPKGASFAALFHEYFPAPHPTPPWQH